MVKINKVATHLGDDGYTTVIGSKRIHKNSVRIEAIGSVDELCSWLGLLRVNFKDSKEKNLLSLISEIQNDLFDLGSELACVGKKKSPLALTSDKIKSLDLAIDTYNDSLAELKSFILPGSSIADAWLHIARTVCRRAERRVAQLCKESELSKINQIYLNRLSDLLFVISRYLRQKNKDEEVLWKNQKPQKGEL